MRLGLLCISFIFLIAMNPRWVSGKPLCNGSAPLCHRRYNEVSFATSHNGMATQKNSLLALLPGSNISDQDRNLIQQLDDGIHAMKFPIHPFENEIYACHGLSKDIKETIERKICENLGFLEKICGGILNSVNPCELDPATKTLKQTLKIFAKFLDSHPQEVLTLFLEDDAADFEHLGNILRESGILPFIHSQNLHESWPTLKQMIQSGRRLVLFNNLSQDKKGLSIYEFPTLNLTSDYVWQTRYSFHTLQELRDDDPYQSQHNQKSFLNRNEFPNNKLWVLQHFITPSFGGNEPDASIANAEGLLSSRIEKYKSMVGSNPNFIWVDFYELPRSSPGLFYVVDRLNHEVPSSIRFFQK